MQVEIYIETDYRGPARRKAIKGMYVLETTLPHNEVYTVDKEMCLADSTENKMVLTLLIDALSRMNTRDCTLQIFTQNEYVMSTIENGWNESWMMNEWKNSSGKEVKNKAEWQKLTEQLSAYTYSFTKEHHSYRSWMQSEMKRR